MKYTILLCILFAASVTDIKTFRIPNSIILTGLLFAAAFMIPHPSNLGWFLLSVAGLFLLGLTGIFGAGDVKLWMVIAGFLGFLPSLFIFLAAQCLLFFYVLVSAPEKFGLSLTSPSATIDWFRLRKVSGNYYPLAPFMFVATAGWIILVITGAVAW